MGQSPQYHNHNPHGNCNYVWHGKLHVTNGKVKTENGNLFYPPLCRFATPPLSQVRSQLQSTCGHIGSTLYSLPYRGGYGEGSISNLLLTL